MGATAVISAYNCRINNYNLVLVTSWYILQQMFQLQIWVLLSAYKYYNDLISQIGRSFAQDQVVKVSREVMNLKLFM